MSSNKLNSRNNSAYYRGRNNRNGSYSNSNKNNRPFYNKRHNSLSSGGQSDNSSVQSDSNSSIQSYNGINSYKIQPANTFIPAIYEEEENFQRNIQSESNSSLSIETLSEHFDFENISEIADTRQLEFCIQEFKRSALEHNYLRMKAQSKAKEIINLGQMLNDENRKEVLDLILINTIKEQIVIANADEEYKNTLIRYKFLKHKIDKLEFLIEEFKTKFIVNQARGMGIGHGTVL